MAESLTEELHQAELAQRHVRFLIRLAFPDPSGVSWATAIN
jgi:hypothetical protein